VSISNKEIIVKVPPSFIEEKKYVFDILFQTILGLDYDFFIESNIADYEIYYKESKIIIKDVFFSSLEQSEEYYFKQELIPNKLAYINESVCGIDKIPVIFGEGNISRLDSSIKIESDLIASAFFMLTRWEEIAIKERDLHGRFPEELSYVIKYKINHLPIVNIYAELIVKMLQEFGLKHLSKKEYQVYLTHDIDDFARYDKFSKFAKALVGDIVKRFSIKAYFQTLSDYFKIKLKKINDVYDTFDFLMNESNRIGVKSHFYFIAGKLGENDVRFDIDHPDVQKKISTVLKNGHYVGIHPSYDTYCDFKQLNVEIKRLKKYNYNVLEGRQHYLRFKIPQTWNDWSNSGLKVDSSLGFYANIGFRCGICNEYETFNVITSKKTGLCERPLIVMDTALKLVSQSKEDAVSLVKEISDTVRCFKGDFVLLWHNSNLTRNEWYGWDKVYIDILDKVKK
jgi:hypothetical protein